MVVAHIHPVAASRLRSGFFLIEVKLHASRRRFPQTWAWLLVVLCIGQSLLPEMVLCVEEGGHLAVEPSIGGKCSDLVQAAPAGTDLGGVFATPAYCELCQDLPLASGTAYQLPPPVQTRVLLLTVPAMALHPLFQPLAATSYPTRVLFPPLPAPSSARIALRSTILLI